MSNVLFFSNQNSFKGGAPRSLYEIISNIDRDQFNPFFASIHDGELAKKIKEINVPFLHLDQKNPFTPPFFAISSIIPIIRFIQKNKIDIIHNNQCNDGLYSFIPGKITRTPIIIHHRDISFYKRSRFLSNHVDANIAISSWQNEKNLDKKAILIHNGIVITKFKTEKSIKKRFLEPDDGKVKIGLLGRITYVKGQDTFIKAAALILEKYSHVHFYIIGDDKDPASQDYIELIKSLVTDLNIKNSITFTGYLPQSWKFLPELDISVVPSRKEPFGRVTIESMACAKPVIATNVGGAMDIVTPETGILIPPDNPSALANSIIKFLESPKLRSRMGKAGRKRVEEYFTISKMLHNIQNIYYSLLEDNIR